MIVWCPHCPKLWSASPFIGLILALGLKAFPSTLLLLPLIFHRCYPNKSLAHLDPSCHLVLTGHKLTHLWITFYSTQPMEETGELLKGGRKTEPGYVSHLYGTRIRVPSLHLREHHSCACSSSMAPAPALWLLICTILSSCQTYWFLGSSYTTCSHHLQE